MKDRSLKVGDSQYNCAGAEEAKMDFFGVLYNFGSEIV